MIQVFPSIEFLLQLCLNVKVTNYCGAAGQQQPV